MDLQPGLLNRANKALVKEAEAQEAKLAKLRLELARVEHDAREKEAKLARYKSQREPLDLKLSALQLETEASRRRAKTAEREGSALRQETARKAEEYYATKARVDDVRVRVDLAKTRVQKFEHETKLSEAALAEWAEHYEAMAGQAEFLTKLKAAEVAAFTAAREERDAMNVKILSAKEELETEMRATEALRIETERVLRDITADAAERNATLEDLRKVHAQLAQSEGRAEDLASSLEAVKGQVARDAALKASLEKDAAKAADAAKGLEGSFHALVARRNTVAAARVNELDQERSEDASMLALEREVERAARELALTHAAMQDAHETLGKRHQSVLRAEVEMAAAQEEWERVQAALAAQQDHDRAVDHEALRQRHIRRLNAAIKDLQRGHRALAELKEEAASARQENAEIIAQIERCRRDRRGAAEGALEAEEAVAECDAVLASLDTVRQLRIEHIEAAEARLNKYRAALLEKAGTLREVLRVGETVTGPLKAACAGAHGALINVKKELVDMEGFVEEAHEAERLLKREMKRLAAELQQNEGVKGKKEQEAAEVKKVQAKLHKQVVGAVEGCEEEEAHREELAAELKKRMADIDAHQDLKKATLRAVEEERRQLAAELQEKQRAQHLLELRYRETLKALYAMAALHEGDEDTVIQEGDYNRIREEELETLTPEEIHARHLANIARVRMHLQERGDALDTLLVKTVKENKKLSKVVDSVQTSYAAKKREVSQIAWKLPTACEQLSVFADGTSKETSTDPELHDLRMACHRHQGDIDAYVEILRERTAKQQVCAADLKARKAELTSLQRRIADAQKRVTGPPSRPLSTPLDRLLAWASKLDRSSLLACRTVLARHGVPAAILPAPRAEAALRIEPRKVEGAVVPRRSSSTVPPRGASAGPARRGASMPRAGSAAQARRAAAVAPGAQAFLLTGKRSAFTSPRV
eukprot:TRINITY_DN7413_c0_g2_i1.p1 TRINITY_DN7413_c0_g2~~TRINITY_DN7413_c0_g2_i1.p1  ORF type:complete len:941 (+),score=386.38 TRINITY_DN7413_c0_g2_i1:163-2985(+)